MQQIDFSLPTLAEGSMASKLTDYKNHFQWADETFCDIMQVIFQWGNYTTSSARADTFESYMKDRPKEFWKLTNQTSSITNWCLDITRQMTVHGVHTHSSHQIKTYLKEIKSHLRRVNRGEPFERMIEDCITKADPNDLCTNIETYLKGFFEEHSRIRAVMEEATKYMTDPSGLFFGHAQ